MLESGVYVRTNSSVVVSAFSRNYSELRTYELFVLVNVRMLTAVCYTVLSFLLLGCVRMFECVKRVHVVRVSSTQ